MIPLSTLGVEITFLTLLIGFLRHANNRIAILSTLFSSVWAGLEIYLNSIIGFYVLSDSIIYHIYYYMIYTIVAVSMIRFYYLKQFLTETINLILYMTVLEDVMYYLLSLSDPKPYFLYPLIGGIPLDQIIIIGALTVFKVVKTKWKL